MELFALGDAGHRVWNISSHDRPGSGDFPQNSRRKASCADWIPRCMSRGLSIRRPKLNLDSAVYVWKREPSLMRPHARDPEEPTLWDTA
jgi:hypothetical protein